MARERDFKALIKATKVPVLILDQKWHQLFLVNGKPDEIAEKEKELDVLIKREAHIKNDIRDYKKVKQTLMDEIVAGMENSGEEHQAEVQDKKRLIDDANGKIDELQDELLDLPNRIKEVNDDLMELTANYCYENFRVNTEKINEITAWIKQVRHDLKVNVVKKQNREINIRQMYSYMHDVFGPRATDLFDLQNQDIDLSYQSERQEEG